MIENTSLRSTYQYPAQVMEGLVPGMCATLITNHPFKWLSQLQQATQTQSRWSRPVLSLKTARVGIVAYSAQSIFTMQARNTLTEKEDSECKKAVIASVCGVIGGLLCAHPASHRLYGPEMLTHSGKLFPSFYQLRDLLKTGNLRIGAGMRMLISSLDWAIFAASESLLRQHYPQLPEHKIAFASSFLSLSSVSILMPHYVKTIMSSQKPSLLASDAKRMNDLPLRARVLFSAGFLFLLTLDRAVQSTVYHGLKLQKN
jgi:hypothetical protein